MSKLELIEELQLLGEDTTGYWFLNVEVLEGILARHYDNEGVLIYEYY